MGQVSKRAYLFMFSALRVNSLCVGGPLVGFLILLSQPGNFNANHLTHPLVPSHVCPEFNLVTRSPSKGSQRLYREITTAQQLLTPKTATANGFNSCFIS